MAAASANFSLKVTLFVYVMLMMGATMTQNSVAKVCPLDCLNVEYATCLSSGAMKLKASCNCCLSDLSSGCTLHLADGSTSNCS
ncbi:hypothetical protein Dimus_019048 [Dionaea muscipula]